MLLRQVPQKSALFVTVEAFSDKGFAFQLFVCNRCHDVFMMFVDLNSNYEALDLLKKYKFKWNKGTL